MSAKPEVKAIVIATDPTGTMVGFETAGWQAAHRLQQVIDNYPNRSYGWKYIRTIRLVSQREVR